MKLEDLAGSVRTTLIESLPNGTLIYKEEGGITVGTLASHGTTFTDDGADFRASLVEDADGNVLVRVHIEEDRA